MKNAYLVAVSQLDFLDNRELSLQDIYSLCQMHSFTFPRHKIQMTRYLNLFPVNMAHRERTAIGQKPRLFQGQLQGPAFHSFTRLNPSFTSGKLTHSTNFGRSLRLFARYIICARTTYTPTFHSWARAGGFGDKILSTFTKHVEDFTPAAAFTMINNTMRE